MKIPPLGPGARRLFPGDALRCPPEDAKIGLPEARDAFASSLRDALCTPEEVAAWQRGETFNDPWPKDVRTIS